MRVFYIPLQQADFESVLASQWQSPVIDLYENQWYINYSTVKSYYGQESVPGQWASGKKFVWTGFKDYSFDSINDNYDDFFTTYAGEGYYDGERYRDFTGPINIVGYSLVTPSTYTGNTTFDLYMSRDNSPYIEEWISSTGYTQSGGIDFTDAERFMQFNLNFDITPPVGSTVYVRIEIGPPVIAPKYQVTREVLNNFPEWMAIREYDEGLQDATPQLAKDTSLGGGLINAVTGEWLEDIKDRIRDSSYDLYIDTVDLTQMAWCYKTTNVSQYLTSIIGDGVVVGLAYDLSEFYEAADDEYVAWWDESRQILYCNRLYTSLSLNGIVYTQQLQQIWNAIDELGLLVDLPRISGESNLSYQARIKDVFVNPLGAGVDSFKLALRREFNMWSLYGSTPDSNFLGATPDVLEISDIEVDPDYVYSNQLPTQKFFKLVDTLAMNYPATWGYFKWDNMLWDMGGTDYSGFTTLPKQYDATPLLDSDTQSGVGDGEDLLVLRPDSSQGPQSFNAELILRGQKAVTTTHYPPTNITIDVQGQGTIPVYDNPTTNVWFTVEMTLFADEATPGYPTQTYVYSFELTSTSDVNNAITSPTAASFASIELINPAGYVNPSFNFQTKYLNSLGVQSYLNDLYAAMATPSSSLIHTSQVQSLTIQRGKWNPYIGGGNYVQAPSTDIFEAWLSSDPGDKINYATGSLSINNNYAYPTPLFRTSLVMSSSQISVTDQEWLSETFTIPFVLNDTSDITTQTNTTIALPNINWDPAVYNVGGSYTRNYVITIQSNNGSSIPEYGGLVNPVDSAPYYVDPSYIYVNGTNAWNGNAISLSINTTALVFSMGSGANYPIIDNLWEPFVSDPYVLHGIVDENGPWIDGFPPASGAGTDDDWVTLSLTRDNFNTISNLPNFDTDQYVINWIGISVDNSQVVVWLDSNTIIPSTQAGSTNYPTNAIAESKSASTYSFAPFIVHSKLIPGGPPQWYPLIHSGTFFEGQQEYYLYATPSHETTNSAIYSLNTVARQGAPIIVKTNEATPTYLRQVAFFDNSSTPNYFNPTQVGLFNTEIVSGTDDYILYASYPDITSIFVTDVTDPLLPTTVPTLETTVTGNVIDTGVMTYTDRQYSISYQLLNSFTADNAYIDNNGVQRTLLTFEAAPATPYLYIIDYETAPIQNATPVPVPLNPLFTSVDQGFLFISHEEYPVGNIIATINPGKIVADGKDYLYITIRSVDIYENPKPNQIVNITTNFGALSTAQVTTNDDGYASLFLQSSTSIIGLPIDPASYLPQGQITVTGAGISSSMTFLVEPLAATPNQLYAIVGQDSIPADGVSQNVIYGMVVDSNNTPINEPIVTWTKARSNYDLFASTNNTTGYATVDGNTFTIGPFPSSTEPGYWFMAVESQYSSYGATPFSYATESDFIYVSNRTDNTVSVVDNNNNVINTIPVGNGPLGIAIANTEVYVVNFASGTISVIDQTTNQVTATITISDIDVYFTGACVASADGSTIYVASSSSSTSGKIHAIDTFTHKEINSLHVGTQVEWMHLTNDGSQLWVSNGLMSGQILIVNTATLTVTATISSGIAYPNQIANNPQNSGVMYVGNYASPNYTTDVYSTSTHGLLGSHITAFGNITALMVSPDGSTLLCAYAKGPHEYVAFVNTTTWNITNTIQLPTSNAPYGGFWSSDSTTCYVLDGANLMFVIDVTTQTITKTVTVGTNPQNMAIAPGGIPSWNTLYGGATPAYHATPYTPVGDVVYWYEYGTNAYGVDNMDGLPPAPVQTPISIGQIPEYAYGNFYPTSYSETGYSSLAATPILPVQYPNITPVPTSQYPWPLTSPNPNTATPFLQWLPPRWYALPLYTQYQLALIHLNQKHNIRNWV